MGSVVGTAVSVTGVGVVATVLEEFLLLGSIASLPLVFFVVCGVGVMVWVTLGSVASAVVLVSISRVVRFSLRAKLASLHNGAGSNAEA
jgi:hypothetical protein